MATPGLDRYVVVRRPFGYIVSDQKTGEWIGRETRSRESAHRAADKLNRAARADARALRSEFFRGEK